MRRSFRVSVDMPEGVSTTDMTDYIRDAVQTWRGQLHPEDSVYDLKWETVTCRSIPEKKIKIEAKKAKKAKKEKKCPNCGSNKIVLFDADNDMCQTCGKWFPGT